MDKIKKALLIVVGLFSLASTAVWAETVEVNGKGIKYNPLVVFAKPGDTIAFRNMATHFTESILIPDGAEKMLSDMGADYNYSVKKEGVYLYKCPPHWGVRMGGLIVVGDASALEGALDDYINKTDDKNAKGFMKSIKKKIKKGKIKLPE